MLKYFDYDRFAIIKSGDEKGIKYYKVTVKKGAIKAYVWTLTRSACISFIENISVYISFFEKIIDEEEVTVEVEHIIQD